MHEKEAIIIMKRRCSLLLNVPGTALLTKLMCAQQRLSSDCACLCCLSEDTLDPWLPTECPVKTDQIAWMCIFPGHTSNLVENAVPRLKLHIKISLRCFLFFQFFIFGFWFCFIFVYFLMICCILKTKQYNGIVIFQLKVIALHCGISEQTCRN